MILRAIFKGKQIIIPNYWNIKDGEVLIDVNLPEIEKIWGNNELKETAQVLIEHYEEEKRKEVPVNSEKVKKSSRKDRAKRGGTLEDLLNENF